MSRSNRANLLQEIQLELIQQSCSLSNTLRKSLILAHRIKSDSLKSWVNQELNGYTDPKNLPDYRIVAAQSYENRSVPNGDSRLHVPKIPINSDADYVNYCNILNGISTLEDLIGSSHIVEINWAPDRFDILAKMNLENGTILTKAWHQVSISSIAQIIDSAKNRLLNFVLELESYAEKSGDGLGEIPDADIEKLVQTVIINVGGDVNMTHDQYNIDQAGAVGPEAKAEGMTFNQIQMNYQNDVDLSALIEELSKLREAMSKNAKEPEQYIEIGNVAEAEKEAKNGNRSKAFEALGKVGNWALETATAIGTTVTAEIIKK